MDNKLLNLLPKIVSGVVILIGLLLTLMVVMGEDTDPVTLVDLHAEGTIAGYIMLNEVLVFIGALLMVGFAIMHIASNIKESVPTLIGIGVFVLIMGISYAMADTTVLDSWLDPTDPEGNPTMDDVRTVSTWLTATYILLAGASVAWIYNEVSRAIK